jgi:hypothetical protein
MRARAAADITAEIRQAAGQATSAREAAERDLAQLHALEDAAVAAERAAASPPEKVPPSAWTCLLANPLALLMEPDLGQEGRVLVAAQIASLARICGTADEPRAEGRAQLAAEQSDPARHPAQLQALGNGNVGVIPNSMHPGTPTPATPLGPRGRAGLHSPANPAARRVGHGGPGVKAARARAGHTLLRGMPRRLRTLRSPAPWPPSSSYGSHRR